MSVTLALGAFKPSGDGRVQLLKDAPLDTPVLPEIIEALAGYPDDDLDEDDLIDPEDWEDDRQLERGEDFPDFSWYNSFNPSHEEEEPTATQLADPETVAASLGWLREAVRSGRIDEAQRQWRRFEADAAFDGDKFLALIAEDFDAWIALCELARNAGGGVCILIYP
jgi:hypothetical protein